MVNRDTGLLQRVGDVDSVNNMQIEVEPGVQLAESNIVSAADLEDRPFVVGMADTSDSTLGTIVDINGQPLNATRFGGRDYPLQPKNVEDGVLFASGADVVKGFLKGADAAMELPGAKRNPVFGTYQMGGRSTDFATMTADVMVPFARSNLTKKEKQLLDKRIREGAGTKTNEFKPQPDWPGIDSPEAEQWLLNAGGNRKAVTKALDEFRESTGINLSQTRAALVDPAQIDPKLGDLKNLGILDMVTRSAPGLHPSYPINMLGENLGRFAEGANALADLPLLTRVSREPFVPEMLRRGHDVFGKTLPSPANRAMMPGLIGMFNQATLDDLVRKGFIAP